MAVARPNIFSLARMTVSSSGTGTITLNAAATGFLTYDAAGCSTAATGQLVQYAIADTTQSEQATGVYTSSSLTLTRGSSTTGMKSTNSNSAINMTNGAQVMITPHMHVLNDITGKNRIINPGMVYDQLHGGTAQTITAAAAYTTTVDRWLAQCTGANVTGQRISAAAPTGFTHFYRFTGAGAVTAIRFAQAIEVKNAADLTSQLVTVSVQLANTALTTVTWTAYTANAADTFTAYTSVGTGSFTGVSATFTQYAATFNAGANGGNGILLELSVGAQVAGTWSITGVQVEKNAVPTDYELRPPALETSLIERYIEKSYEADTVPATTSQAGYVLFPTAGASVSSGTTVGQIRFRTEKRVTPTVTIFPFVSSATTARISDISGTDESSGSGATSNINTKQLLITNNSTTTLVTSNAGFIAHYLAIAEFST